MMKKFLSILLAALLLAAGIFVLGPRPESDAVISFDKASLGEDLSAYLLTNEKTIPDIVPGAEKQIIWADPATREKTDIAIVYIHGFSATKEELRPVPDRVAEALRANLYYARLAGHGRDGNAMATVTTSDWANDMAEAVAIGERLGNKVLLIGTSTGGTLATWALAQPDLSKNVAGAVFFSPNYELHGISTSMANIPWAKTILPAVAGSERSWEPINDAHGKWWTTSYPSVSIFPMTSYMKLLKDIDKSGLKTPALFVYSPSDKVILPSEVEKVASEWGGPVEIMKLETETDPFHHVIAGDILSPANTGPASEAIIRWAQGL